LPISTEPNGIPGRTTPLDDVAGIAAVNEAPLLEPVPQIAALPGNEVPIPIPPPSYVLELYIPPDALPVAEQVVPAPANPMVPSVSGLSPGDASSVAPKGIPVSGTDAPGTMPSGEVAAIPGVPIPPTCAKAGLQPKSAARVAAINARRIAISIVLRQGSGRAHRSTGPASLISSFGALSILPTLFPDCCDSFRLNINRRPAGTIKLPFGTLNSWPPPENLWAI
jgi:hypothetical protein